MWCRKDEIQEALGGATRRQNERYDGVAPCHDAVACRKTGDLSPTQEKRAYIKGMWQIISQGNAQQRLLLLVCRN